MSAAGKGKIMGAVGSDIVGNVETVTVELSAAQKLYEASARINAARAKLDTHKGQYGPEQAAYRHVEDIDDDLFEALRLLGS